MESQELSHHLPSEGAVLDVAYTVTGDRLATCSVAGVVEVWAARNKSGAWRVMHRHKLGGRPEKLAWADPEYGIVLVVGTATGSVHALQGPGLGGDTWQAASELRCGKGPVQGLAFAPRQHGLLLAVAASDGQVWLFEGACSGPGGRLAWTLLNKIQACSSGPCHSVAWRPFTSGSPPLLLASSDQGAGTWCYDGAGMTWHLVGELASPGGRTPAAALDWAPTMGRPAELAAASFGQAVVIFRLGGSLDDMAAAEVSTLAHPAPVWRLEFSRLGLALACSLESSPDIWFWMPDFAGPAWKAVSRITGSGEAAAGRAPGGDAGMDVE